MDKGYEKEKFEGLKIKASVAQKFREFCKEQQTSQSMNLLHMISFFQDNELAPTDTLETPLAHVEKRFQKRMNALIAIIKDIEKGAIIPTHEMLQLLFEEARGQAEMLTEKNTTIGKQKIELPQPSFEKHEALIKAQQREPIDGYTYYREQYVAQQKRLLHLQRMLQKALKDSKYVSPAFGSGYVRLELTKEAYETLKKEAYVSDHHTTENRE